MGVLGSHYAGENFNAVSLYNEDSDVYTAIPKPMKGNHVMHVVYSYENKSSSFDVYLVTHMDATNFDKKRTITPLNHSDIITENVLFNQNVRFESIKDIRGTALEKSLERMAAIDIGIHCRNESEEKGTSTAYVNRIIPKTKIHYTKPKFMVKAGKSEFVPSCLLNANIDFSAGCISGFVPTENASFNDDTFIGYYHDKLQECDYCYAMDKHKVYPKTFMKINKKKLREELLGNFEDFSNHIVGEPQGFARFGKRTEPGAIYNRPQLVDCLEVMCDTGTRGIIPNKWLEFDPELAKLFKKSRSILLASLGTDEQENGAVIYGRENEVRIEHAIKYHEKGVLSGLYIMHDVTERLDEKTRAWIEDAKKRHMPVQLLAKRIMHTDLAIPMTGKPWYILQQGRGQTTFEGHTLGGYKSQKNHSLVAEYMHPEIVQLIGKNNGQVRLCHHNSHDTYCGSCFMCKGFVTETVEPRLKPIKKYKKKPKEFTLKMDLFNNKDHQNATDEIND